MTNTRALWLFWIVLFGCAVGTLSDDAGAEEDTRDGTEDVEECCERKRESQDDAGESDAAARKTPAQISISEDTLYFGTPYLRTEISRSFTITNFGETPLEIGEVMLTEDDAHPEYRLLNDVRGAILENESRELTIVLQSTDNEADLGEIRIVSNDPEQPVAWVALVSEVSGDPEVAACVLMDGWVSPFVDCVDEVLWLAGVLGGGWIDATPLSVWNNGDGNQGLTIQRLWIADDDGDEARFAYSVALLWPATGAFEKADLPLFLPAADPESVSYPYPSFTFMIFLSYNAATEDECIGPAFFNIETDDAENPIRSILIEGHIYLPEY